MESRQWQLDLRPGRQLFLGRHAGEAHRGQQGRVVRVASTVAEPAQDEPVDRFVDVVAGRVRPAHAAQDREASGGTFQDGGLARAGAQIEHRDPSADRQTSLRGIAGGGRLGLGEAAQRAEVGQIDGLVERGPLRLAPVAGLGEDDLARRSAELSRGPIPGQPQECCRGLHGSEGGVTETGHGDRRPRRAEVHQFDGGAEGRSGRDEGCRAEINAKPIVHARPLCAESGCQRQDLSCGLDNLA